MMTDGSLPNKWEDSKISEGALFNKWDSGWKASQQCNIGSRLLTIDE